jgi:hypothetical protein
MITTQNEFEDETAWERTVLAYAIPVMPLTASGAGLDLRTRTISIELTATVGGESVEALRNSLLPLLFGAAWKILDLALELAFAQAGLVPQNGRRWTIAGKSQHAAAHRGSLPGLLSTTDVWHALGSLYAQTVEIRHALVHRRVQVDLSTRDLIAFTSNGVALPALSYDEQMAFCRFAQRLGQVIAESTLRPRVEADLRKQLAELQRHHGEAILSNASNRPPVRVIDDLPARGQIDVPYLLGEARARFPGAQYVDLELLLVDGRSLVGELESAPQGIVTVDPAAPPAWLSFT